MKSHDRRQQTKYATEREKKFPGFCFIKYLYQEEDKNPYPTEILSSCISGEEVKGEQRGRIHSQSIC